MLSNSKILLYTNEAHHLKLLCQDWWTFPLSALCEFTSFPDNSSWFVTFCSDKEASPAAKISLKRQVDKENLKMLQAYQNYPKTIIELKNIPKK